jgi:cell division protein ZapA (FtsZ GTPase activity inhibitor)
VSSKRTVAVTIQGREYKVRAEGDGGSVQRAALLLDDTMSKVRERSGIADSVDIAVLAALNLANSLVGERGQTGGLDALQKRIGALVEVVEAALAAPASAS